MAVKFDLRGMRFSRLVALEPARSTRRGVSWRCRCDCGAEVVVHSHHLRTGHTTSCGCLKRELTVARFTTHGLSNRCTEWSIWTGMRQRCNDPNSPQYPYYGGRGITISPAWDDFATFFADMGPRPSPRHSIDRIDNDGPYAPGNCRWATRQEQRRNRRDSITLTHEGRTLALVDWAKELGIKYKTLHFRYLKNSDPAVVLRKLGSS